MPIAVRPATADEIARWDLLVLQFPGWRVFHLRSWIESIEAFAGVNAIYLMVERGGERVGCIPGFLVRVGPLRAFCSPREGWQSDSMGPLFDPTRVDAAELLAALVTALERHFGVHHIEMAAPGLDAAAMEGLRFQGRKVFTYRAELHPGDPAKTLSAVHPRTRTYMRSLTKGNLIAAINEDQGFVDEHYQQIQGVFARRGTSVPFSKERVRQLVNHMRPSGHLLTVAIRTSDHNRCIATGLFLVGGTELHLWSWAHREEFGRLHPIELLTWVAMQKGMEAGCTSLDFSGGGQAKAKYGAAPDETNVRWMRSRYRWIADLRHLAVRGYRMQQTARGRVTRLAARFRHLAPAASDTTARL